MKILNSRFFTLEKLNIKFIKNFLYKILNCTPCKKNIEKKMPIRNQFTAKHVNLIDLNIFTVR